MALVPTQQDDFGGGIYSGRKAPADTVYDLVNGLVNDEGLIYRRGGSAYYSSSDAPASIRRMISGYMRAVSANRVLVNTAAATYVLDGSLAPVATGTVLPINSRPAAVGNYLIFMGDAISTVYYAGSLKSTQYTTGTVTVTNGSTTVTGSGTSWLANADAGMLFYSASATSIAVKSVDSNTQLKLTDPWPYPTASGAAYELNALLIASNFGFGAGRSYVAAAGAGTPRLLYGIGNRVYFSERGDPFTINETDYHEMPANALIIGIEGRGDSAWVFTTAGVWAIGNLSLDPIDDYGNIQHTVQQVSKDVILWDDFGVSGFAGGLVIPCVDDVFLADPDFGLTAITGRIRPVYRSYVKAGYQPGFAAVHRGHYFLPIMNGTSLVDVLVCRLDRQAAWVTWAGGAAGAAYATLITETSRTPKLLGINGARVTDLTDTFDPSETNATDADGTTSDFEIITRDYPTGANQPGFAQKLRVRYEYEPVGFVLTESGADLFAYSNGDLPSPWLAWTDTTPVVTSGVAAGPSDSVYYDATRPESLAADSYAEAILEGNYPLSGGLRDIGVGIRLTAHSVAADGYMLQVIDNGSNVRALLRKGAAFSSVTSSGYTFSNVDGIRLVTLGGEIKGYLRCSGVWTLAVSATDSTYTAGGYPGFWVQKSSGAVFGITSFSWGTTSLGRVVPAFSSDADDDVYAELDDRGEQNGGGGWADSDGALYQWANVGKRRERIRFRLTVSGACARFVLRSLELLTRPSGRQ